MIISKNNAPHYQWSTGCDAWVLSQSDKIIIKEEIRLAETEEALHRHQSTEQFFYICEGEAFFYLDGKEYILRSGDFIRVKINATHNISNKSIEPLRFLVISVPGNTNDRIVCPA